MRRPLSRVQIQALAERERRRRAGELRRQEFASMSDEEVFAQGAEDELLRSHPDRWGRSISPPSTYGMTAQQARVAMMTNGELLTGRDAAAACAIGAMVVGGAGSGQSLPPAGR